MLPTKWIDEIFRRLSVRYGREFSLKYENLDPEAVKRDWAEYLAGFEGRPDAIEYALKNLPESKSPNVAEFATICRRAPIKSELALPHFETPEEKERAAQRLQQLKEMLSDKQSWVVL